jgi:pre-mRNA-processing factor 6
LQEQEGNFEQVDAIIANGVSALKKNGAELSREQWLSEAERAETQGSPITSQAIIKATLHLDVEEEDRQTRWMEDAVEMEKKGLVGGARAIYAYCLNVFPQKAAIWRKAAELEKAHGQKSVLCPSRETLADDGVVGNRCSLFSIAQLPQFPRQRSSGYVPLSPLILNSTDETPVQLMAAKESWLADDVPGAREILGRAFAANPESEGIWLAAIKLEAENGQIEAARQLMERARDVAGTERVSPSPFLRPSMHGLTMHLQIWLKSAVFERQHGTSESALATVKLGIARYPACEKLHMVHAQILLAQTPPNISAAREAISVGVKKCPQAVPLWIMSSKLEEQAGMRIKSRAVLEKARASNPKSDVVWLESVRVEERDGSGAAKGMLARGESNFHLLLETALTPYLPQHSKLCQHLDRSTPTPSGPSLVRRASLDPSTRSRRRTTPSKSSSPSLVSSGPNERLTRRVIGSRGLSRRILILEMRGDGGSDSRRTMVLQ